jgi:thymidylate synthase
MATDYDDPLIRRFAEYFGKPSLRVEVAEGKIAEVEVLRDAACGCVRYVAEHLVGTNVDDSVDEAGMLHHHYPCLASMNKDQDYLDTLMHVSGNILQDALKDEVRGHLSPVPYLRPQGKSEDTDNKIETEEK